MSLSVASNIPSLTIQTALRRSSDALSKTYERLSSGLRINRASDDPAGLALADSLRSQGNSYAIASLNANNGLSVTSITDSGLGDIITLLSRMAELAQQSSNGIYTTAQRTGLSSEFIALGSEIDRIAKTTSFNGFSLLSNSSNITIQVGIDASANSQITIQAVQATLNSLSLAGGSGALTYSLTDTTTDAAMAASRLAYSAVSNAIDTVSSRRGLVGAAESRLRYSVDYIAVMRENVLAAESSIRDVDVAQEITELTRLQVLQQAQTAVLAQANLQPQLVLKLLS